MTTIGQYEIRGELGRGGIGRVDIGYDTVLGREVAIKSLHPELINDSGFVERFRSEATSLARLNHPNITTLFALIPDGQNLYMVMELVRGSTIESLLKKRGEPIDQTTALALASQIGEGLSYAHGMGVIHRDIKPANLMVTDSGLLKIMDFGIARVQGGQRLTRDGSIVGTLAYMSPEQLKGAQGDQRSDLYSLAIVVYEMLAGEPPFRGATDYELMDAQIKTPPQPLRNRAPGVDPSVDAAIMKALEKSPDNRFPDVASFIAALCGTDGKFGATRSVNLSRDVLKIGGKTIAMAVQQKASIAQFTNRRMVGPIGGAMIGGLAAAVAIVMFAMFGNRVTGGSPTTSQQQATLDQSLNNFTTSAPKVDISSARANNNLFPNNSNAQPSRQGGANAPSEVKNPENASRPLQMQSATSPSPSPSNTNASLGDMADAELAAARGEFIKALAISLPYAEKKNPDAQFLVGRIYNSDRGGVAKNPGEAFVWFRRAAEQGNAKAQFNLGLIYFNGNEVVPKDRANAAFWFRRAADQGDMDAAYNLGRMYYAGDGLERNVQSSIDLFQRVARSGSARSAEAQKVLEAIRQ